MGFKSHEQTLQIDIKGIETQIEFYFYTPTEDTESYKWTQSIQDAVSELIPYGSNFLDRIYKIHEIREIRHNTGHCNRFMEFNSIAQSSANSISTPDFDRKEQVQEQNSRFQVKKASISERRNSFTQFERQKSKEVKIRKIGVVHHTYSVDN